MATRRRALLPKLKWQFVANEELRKILARDYAELRLLLRTRAYKSTVVICGSILEAVLVSTLQNQDETSVQAKYAELFPRKSGRPLDEWELHELIKVSEIG